MIRASGINVVMEGPEFLQYAETGMILKKTKENLIEEHGKEKGMEMFKNLLDTALLDEEELLKLEAENRKNHPELSATLDGLVGLISLML